MTRGPRSAGSLRSPASASCTRSNSSCGERAGNHAEEAFWRTAPNNLSVNPYTGEDEGEPSSPAHPTPPQPKARRSPVLLSLLVVIALATVVAAVASTVSAINTRRLVIEQKRETCYERFAWLNGASDFDSSMPEENTLDARARHAKRCDGDNPLTQYDKR